MVKKWDLLYKSIPASGHGKNKLFLSQDSKLIAIKKLILILEIISLESLKKNKLIAMFYKPSSHPNHKLLDSVINVNNKKINIIHSSMILVMPHIMILFVNNLLDSNLVLWKKALKMENLWLHFNNLKIHQTDKIIMIPIMKFMLMMFNNIFKMIWRIQL